LALLAPGSYAADIQQNTSNFDSGVQKTIQVLTDYYGQINDFEREIYTDSAFINPGQRVGQTDNKRPTGLVASFSDDDLKLRMGAVTIISNYSKGLIQLSDPTKAKTAEADLQSIGARFQAIATSFGAAAAANPWIAAASAIGGLALKHFVRLKQETALKELIKTGAPQISRLLFLLKSDTQNIQNTRFRAKSDTDLNMLIDYYDNHFCDQAHSSDQEIAARSVVLDRIKNSATRYAQVRKIDPAAQLEKMRQINQELLNWATATRDHPFDMETLRRDVDSFSVDADTLISAASEAKVGILGHK
jgi:hypothetical protein